MGSLTQEVRKEIISVVDLAMEDNLRVRLLKLEENIKEEITTNFGDCIENGHDWEKEKKEIDNLGEINQKKKFIKGHRLPLSVKVIKKCKKCGYIKITNKTISTKIV